jgi:cellulose biosynthesis protein BcsQ
MTVAHLAILPCGPSAPDAWALADSIKTIAEAIDYRLELKAVMAINKMRAGAATAKGARAALFSAGLVVLVEALGLRQPFQEALAAGQEVGAYAPKGAAAEELRAGRSVSYRSKMTRTRSSFQAITLKNAGDPATIRPSAASVQPLALVI